MTKPRVSSTLRVLSQKKQFEPTKTPFPWDLLPMKSLRRMKVKSTLNFWKSKLLIRNNNCYRSIDERFFYLDFIQRIRKTPAHLNVDNIIKGKLHRLINIRNVGNILKRTLENIW